MAARPIGSAFAGLGAIVVILGLIKASQIMAMVAEGKSFVPPPSTVAASEVKADVWETLLPAVGTVTPVQGADLASEVGGVVAKILFENGAQVQKDALLVELDTSTEIARHRSAEAKLHLTRLDLARATELRKQRTISQSELDTAQANALAAQAVVEELASAIAKRQIRAPFAGRTGIRKVNLGQYVAPGSPLLTLQSLDPVFVDFSLPQQRVSQVAPSLSVRIKLDSGVAIPGTLTTVDPIVDPSTRNVKLQATVPNPSGILRPGMFVGVEVVLPEKKDVLVVPVTALLFAPYGDSVFVVDKVAGADGKETLKARQQFVRVGESRGDFVALKQGVKAGELVVTAGAFKLRNGMGVVLDNALAPDASLSPAPPNK